MFSLRSLRSMILLTITFLPFLVIFSNFFQVTIAGFPFNNSRLVYLLLLIKCYLNNWDFTLTFCWLFKVSALFLFEVFSLGNMSPFNTTTVGIRYFLFSHVTIFFSVFTKIVRVSLLFHQFLVLDQLFLSFFFINIPLVQY